MADGPTAMSRTDSKKVRNRSGEKRKSDAPKLSKKPKKKNYVVPLSDGNEIIFYPLPRDLLELYDGDVSSCMHIARCIYESEKFIENCHRELDLILNKN